MSQLLLSVQVSRLLRLLATLHLNQGINEGGFYTFEGLFQLEKEGSRRCNTMNLLTLYLYKCLSNGRPLNSEDGR